MPLIHYWGFEGNANDMVGTNNGAGTDVSVVAGVESAAYSFNGSSSTIAVSNLVSGLSNFSVSVWVKPAGVTGDRCILCFTNNVMIRQNTAGLFWVIGANARPNSTYYWGTVNNMFASAVWHHFVITASVNTFKLYKNGTFASDLTSSQGAGGNFTGTAIGSGAGYYYYGTIDEVAIWNEAIDVATIKNNYTYHKGYY